MNTINLKGHIQPVQTVTGHISKGKSMTGKISKPSNEHAKSDHVFVIVDLLKIHEQRLTVNSINAVVPFTATNTQSENSQFSINAVSTVTAVTPMTVNAISFSATNITINEGVYNNANQ